MVNHSWWSISATQFVDYCFITYSQKQTVACKHASKQGLQVSIWPPGGILTCWWQARGLLVLRLPTVRPSVKYAPSVSWCTAGGHCTNTELLLCGSLPALGLGVNFGTNWCRQHVSDLNYARFKGLCGRCAYNSGCHILLAGGGWYVYCTKPGGGATGGRCTCIRCQNRNQK